MEASQGRTQTTLGVWMGKGLAKSDKEETVLVFDVEGTDSRERGEQAHVCTLLRLGKSFFIHALPFIKIV